MERDAGYWLAGVRSHNSAGRSGLLILTQPWEHWQWATPGQQVRYFALTQSHSHTGSFNMETRRAVVIIII